MRRKALALFLASGLTLSYVERGDTSHPAVLLLFPAPMPDDKPKLEDKGNGHWVVSAKEMAVVNGQKVPLGIALAVAGHAPD